MLTLVASGCVLAAEDQQLAAVDGGNRLFFPELFPKMIPNPLNILDLFVTH